MILRGAVDRTVAAFGRLDVLVNNAGTAIPMKVEETTLADFDRVFAVNLRGAFVATQAALKHIKSGGRIIMIGSCIGERSASYIDPSSNLTVRFRARKDRQIRESEFGTA